VGTDLEVSPQSYKIARAIGELLTGTNRTAERAKVMAGQAEGQDVSASTIPDSAAGVGAGVGGCGIIFDYGGDEPMGNTFRVRKHAIYIIFSLLF
jgi:hypothetical protein